MKAWKIETEDGLRVHVTEAEFNRRRVHFETLTRHEYVDSFLTPAEARRIAKALLRFADGGKR